MPVAAVPLGAPHTQHMTRRGKADRDTRARPVIHDAGTETRASPPSPIDGSASWNKATTTCPRLLAGLAQVLTRLNGSLA